MNEKTGLDHFRKTGWNCIRGWCQAAMMSGTVQAQLLILIVYQKCSAVFADHTNKLVPLLLAVVFLRRHQSLLTKKVSLISWIFKKKNAKNEKPGTSIAAGSLKIMNSAILAKLKLLFQTAHALAKHGKPYTDFPWMCTLDKAKWLDIGKTYHTDKYAAQFVHFISQAQILNNLSIF